MSIAWHTILWVVAALVAIRLVYRTVGIHYMVCMFPEGRRWWQLPAQMASLGFFAAVALFHPFGR